MIRLASESEIKKYDKEFYRLRSHDYLHIGVLKGYVVDHTEVDSSYGFLHGSGIEYYLSDHSKQYMTCEWIDNKKNGEASLYDKNGLCMYSCVFKNDVISGKGDIYEDGVLVFSGSFENNEKNGSGYEWKNGVLLFEGYYCNGKRHGWGCTYKENGIHKEEGIWENGKQTSDQIIGNEKSLVYVKRFNENGAIVYVGGVNKVTGEANGYGIMCDQSTNTRQFCLLENGSVVRVVKEMIEAEMKEYDIYGNLVYVGEYKDSYSDTYPRDGNGIEYDVKGNMEYKGRYEMNKRSGEGKEFKNGICVYDGLWKDNMRSGRGKSYDEKGSIQFDGLWKENTVVMEHSSSYMTPPAYSYGVPSSYSDPTLGYASSPLSVPAAMYGYSPVAYPDPAYPNSAMLMPMTGPQIPYGYDLSIYAQPPQSMHSYPYPQSSSIPIQPNSEIPSYPISPYETAPVQAKASIPAPPSSFKLAKPSPSMKPSSPPSNAASSPPQKPRMASPSMKPSTVLPRPPPSIKALLSPPSSSVKSSPPTKPSASYENAPIPIIDAPEASLPKKALHQPVAPLTKKSEEIMAKSKSSSGVREETKRKKGKGIEGTEKTEKGPALGGKRNKKENTSSRMEESEHNPPQLIKKAEKSFKEDENDFDWLMKAAETRKATTEEDNEGESDMDWLTKTENSSDNELDWIEKSEDKRTDDEEFSWDQFDNNNEKSNQKPIVKALELKTQREDNAYSKPLPPFPPPLEKSKSSKLSSMKSLYYSDDNVKESDIFLFEQLSKAEERKGPPPLPDKKGKSPTPPPKPVKMITSSKNDSASDSTANSLGMNEFYISADAMARYYQFFKDISSQTVLCGDEIIKFYKQQKVGRAIIMKVLHIVDTTNTNQFFLREFAIVSHIIYLYRQGKEIPTTVPKTIAQSPVFHYVSDCFVTPSFSISSPLLACRDATTGFLLPQVSVVPSSGKEYSPQGEDVVLRSQNDLHRMQQAEHVVIQGEGMSFLRSFELKKVNTLRTLIIGNCVCRECSSFVLAELPEIETLYVGEDSFSKSDCSDKNNPFVNKNAIMQQRNRFAISQCPKLQSIQILNGAFSGTCSCSLTYLPSLQTLQIGDTDNSDMLIHRSFSFCYCKEIELMGLSSLRRVSIGNYAFYSCDSCILRDLPSLDTLSLGFLSFFRTTRFTLQNLPKLCVLTCHDYSLYSCQRLSALNIASLKSISLGYCCFYCLQVIEKNNVSWAFTSTFDVERKRRPEIQIV